MRSSSILFLSVFCGALHASVAHIVTKWDLVNMGSLLEFCKTTKDREIILHGYNPVTQELAFTDECKGDAEQAECADVTMALDSCRDSEVRVLLQVDLPPREALAPIDSYVLNALKKVASALLKHFIEPKLERKFKVDGFITLGGIYSTEILAGRLGQYVAASNVSADGFAVPFYTTYESINTGDAYVIPRGAYIDFTGDVNREQLSRNILNFFSKRIASEGQQHRYVIRGPLAV